MEYLSYCQLIPHLLFPNTTLHRIVLLKATLQNRYIFKKSDF